MRFPFDIQFFGGGGSSSRQYRKRDPEDPRLIDLRNQLLDAIMPGLQAYDPTSWERARERSEWAEKLQEGLGNRLPAMLDQQQSMLNQIPALLGNAPAMVDKAMGLTDQIPGMINQATGMLQYAPGMLDMMTNLAGQMPGMLARLPESLSKGETILDEMMGVVRSGEVPAALTDRMNQSVTKDLQSGMGSMLNSLGSRGVLNSSITSHGTSRLAQQAAEAYNKNYLNAFNSVINGYSQGLQGAQGNTANLLGGVNALGNGISALGSGVNALGGLANTYIGGANALSSGANAINNSVGALGSVANAYAGGANALSGGANALSNAMGAIGNIPAQSYENITAALMPAYNMWKTWQSLYDNREDFDTVVQQGK